MHESTTSENSPEKPNSIQITHKALSIFLLHVTHDKVSLSRQITIPHGFYNYHWGMPRPMINNIPFSRRLNGSWYVSFCQSYISWSPSNVSQNCSQSTRLQLGMLPTEKIFNVLDFSDLYALRQKNANVSARDATKNLGLRFTLYSFIWHVQCGKIVPWPLPHRRCITPPPPPFSEQLV